MKLFLLSISFFCCSSAFSQKIYGTVFNAQGDLLPYSSISIKGTTKGASANENGKFSINLSKGNYTIICQHLGFTTAEKKVTINNDDVELSFILTDQKLSLETVVVKSGGEDPAYGIIRNAIKKRTYYQQQMETFTCNIYGKDLIKLKALPQKILGKKIAEDDKKDAGLDSTGKGIVYLSESLSKVSIAKPNKFKMEVMSSRVSGSDQFGFNFPAFISLYNNNVKVFTEKFNPRGFISPIADGALSFYKYKFLGTIFENGKSISSIRVTPKRQYEPLFSGTINIVDDEWSIHSFDLLLTKKSQLEIVDTLQITQLHVTVNENARAVKNQLIHFDFNQFGIKLGGNFLTVYSDYNTSPTFGKKYFDNIIIKYDTGVNKKTIAYWDSTRAVPLEKEEAEDYQKKDSSFKAEKNSVNTKKYRDSLNKAQQKIHPLDIFVKGIHRFYQTKNNRIFWNIQPLLEPLSPNVEYNPAEGVVTNLKGSIIISKLKSRTGITLEPLIRYGFGNTHLNPSLKITYKAREQDSITTKLKNYSIYLDAGKRISQFNNQSAITALDNTISTLFYGKNYLKSYDNYFATIGFNQRYESGVRLGIAALYEDRLPLDNLFDYTFPKSRSINITPNYPYEKITSQFDRHKAVIIDASISIKPRQKYIQLPYRKVAVGSKYPTFTLSYIKGINDILGSSVNFDKWKLTIQDDKNLKLAGIIKYKLGIGGFLNSSKVFIQDYQHFNGNQTAEATEYLNSFQLAPYYAYSNTASFYSFGHVEHHFNGLITNKIPLFRKLNWNLVAGSNAFYIDTSNNYVEVFGGIENIFKLLRLDFVVGYEGNNIATGLRIGTGGLLGGSVKTGNNNVSINL